MRWKTIIESSDMDNLGYKFSWLTRVHLGLFLKKLSTFFTDTSLYIELFENWIFQFIFHKIIHASFAGQPKLT